MSLVRRLNAASLRWGNFVTSYSSGTKLQAKDYPKIYEDSEVSLTSSFEDYPNITPVLPIVFECYWVDVLSIVTDEDHSISWIQLILPSIYK